MPTKTGKRYKAAVTMIAANNGSQLHTPEEALRLIKDAGSAKFDERVDIVIRLGVDAKQGDQMVRGTVVLPHGTGKSPRVAAFAKGEAAQLAEQAGAEVVGAEDLIARIEGGWKDFDILVATRDMMRLVGRLGKKLGPRMPNPKAGTVGDDLGAMVRDLKAGRIEFRMEKAGIIHSSIGRRSFALEQLTENFAAFIAAVVRARPAAAKGQLIRKIFVSTTMGPSVQVDVAQAQGLSESV